MVESGYLYVCAFSNDRYMIVCIVLDSNGSLFQDGNDFKIFLNIYIRNKVLNLLEWYQFYSN